jgi:hypothetical protein
LFYSIELLLTAVALQDGLLLDTETFYTLAQQEILAGLGKVRNSSSWEMSSEQR